MRTRSSLLLVAGIVFAALTAVVLYRVATDARSSAPARSGSTASAAIVVAAADIPPRTVVTAAMLLKKELPVDAIPLSALRTDGEVVGQTTLVAVPAGSFFLKPQLAAGGGSTGRSIDIEPGKVLVAFPTTDPLTAAGLVAIGDRVDLLATVVSGTGETARKTQTTVQNLEVVQLLGPTEATPNQPRALTFIVDHQVALFLKYLRDSQATVDVAVRSRKELDNVKTQSVNVQVLQETFGFR